jgi:hypothetical protein
LARRLLQTIASRLVTCRLTHTATSANPDAMKNARRHLVRGGGFPLSETAAAHQAVEAGAKSAPW